MTTRLFATTGLALAGLLTLTPCGHAQPHKAKPHKPSKSARTANSGTPKQLAAAYSLDGYTVRPPQGYQLAEHSDEIDRAIIQEFDWTGVKRSDQSQPEFSVNIFAPKPGFEVTNSEKMLSHFQDLAKQHVTDYVQSPVSEVTIHDLDFTRLYWKGTDRETSQHIHGFAYTCVNGLTGIMIIGQDAEPYTKTTVALLEAATQTIIQQ